MSAPLVASALGVAVRIVLGVGLAVLITSVSLRLLGMRRGWGTALLAGALGWGVAFVVAIGVSNWDWGADGLALHLVAIGIPATMTAAVALDLLARPGSLAIGERAGLVVTPRPVRGRPAAHRRVPPLSGARAPRPPGGLRAVALGGRAERRQPGGAPAARPGGSRRGVRQARSDRRDTCRPTAE